MNGVEDLIIYKQYMELIYYMEMILMKYPKSERFALVTNIKNNTYDGMKYIILAYKAFNSFSITICPINKHHVFFLPAFIYSIVS